MNGIIFLVSFSADSLLEYKQVMCVDLTSCNFTKFVYSTRSYMT